ncbi:hypothetical protein Tco_0895107 [Tanacetum coccineum]|uniref:Uncharacterized protein n=1 Tax=Tanacetum coccineum TaxID=301880 RepID=A0ABQ5CDQ1_9ASTR
MREADFELAQRLQVEEQGEITIEERSSLFVELMNKRKKHFAKLRAEEKRRKPPTKAQKRNLMSTYLKNVGGYKYNQLKSKSYDAIQKLFDNEMKRVNTFIPMDSEVMKNKEGIEESSKRTEDELESDKSKKAESSEKKVEGSRKKLIDKHEEAKEDDEAEMKKHVELLLLSTAGTKVNAAGLQLLEELLLINKVVKGCKDRAEGSETRAEGSSKRAGEDLQQVSTKKQKMDADKEKEELKQCFAIVPDDGDDVTIDATSLSVKIPIVDYKIYQEGKKSFFQIIRADGKTQMYLTFSKMLKNFEREDLEGL